MRTLAPLPRTTLSHKHLSYDDHCEGREVGLVRDGASCHREGRGDQGDGGEICVECGRERTEARETVHEVTFDRIAAVLQDDHRDQMMEEVEASKTANETMKEADITTETGEYENVSKVGVEKASTPIAVSTHESRQDATDDDGMSNSVSASVPLERGQPMTTQAETQKIGTVAMRRQEQLGVNSSGEHKTIHKASRWGYSRAAAGRGAGRARCRLARARKRAEKGLFQRQQAPPDMQTGQSENACLRREVPLTTRHTARRTRESDDRTREL